MAKRHYDETSVIRSISKKASVHVSSVNKTIEVIKNSTDVGNKTWGKIDYLCKVCGYSIIFVTSVSKKSSNKNVIEENDYIENNKTAKREAKLNMAVMTKLAMKRAKTN